MSPVEGGRFGSNRPAQTAIIWKCPACDAEQSGPIDQGCASCGNGKPGRVTGETTPAGKRPTQEPSATGSDMERAFVQWMATSQHPDDPFAKGLAWTAFKAGWEIAMSLQQTADSSLPLTGTATTRTIRAALEMFREQILLQHPEEVTTGEWLSAEQVSELLKEYEG